MDKKFKRYTDEEVKQIFTLREQRFSFKEIAEILGRTPESVRNICWAKKHSEKWQNLAEQQRPTETVTVKEKMTFREMIKALYDAGYRIENNQLVCYVKQVVKINDVING